MQAITELTASLAARGIAVIMSEGTPLHIDHLNATDAKELVGAAAKSYVDWYMLTQVGEPSTYELASAGSVPSLVTPHPTGGISLYVSMALVVRAQPLLTTLHDVQAACC